MSKNITQLQDDPLLDIINTQPSPMRKVLRGIVVAALLTAAGLGMFLLSSGNNGNGINYATEEVTLGRLAVTVSATGNLQPTNQVDVGSELSGTIETVYVDENDRVKRGQILAHLDLAKLNDQVTKSSAAVVAAESQVAQMKATVIEAGANLTRLRKVAELSGGKVPSKTEMESAEAALQRAEANEANARAMVAQTMATLKSDKTNLGKATIRSPIDGVVLTRKVEPGQTVAASLQAPVLFTLAENLTQMELQVDVDEADVSQVKQDQSAIFTVDAWPGRKYPATITRVGFGAQTKDGVVSYKTILKVSNDDLTLRPGMTATAEIMVATHENALLLSNAALRFKPAQTGQAEKGGGILASLLPRGPAQPKQKKTLEKGATPQVWILRENKPIPIPVTVGMTDGGRTEILSGDLKPGMQVITEAQKLKK